MPIIARFFGILVKMFFNEHNPPHFHAEYEGREAQIDIRTGHVLEGALPPRALKLVEEWRQLHVEELMEDWELARNKQLPNKIEPLE